MSCYRCGSKKNPIDCYDDGNYPIKCLECIIKDYRDYNNPVYISCIDILEVYIKLVEENKQLLEKLKTK